MFTSSAQAQIPASLPDNPIATVALTPPSDDVTVNADMLMTHQHRTNPLKAVVWDEGSPTSCTPSQANVHIRVEDWNGNVTTAFIPDAAHADIVLGDHSLSPGLKYTVAVTFVDVSTPTLHWQRVRFYEILNPGTPGIVVNLVSVQPLNNLPFTPAPGGPCPPPIQGYTTLYDTEHFPHLDVVPRPGAGPGGLPLMEEVVITYDGGTLANPQVFYTKGNMTTGLLAPPTLLANGRDPDVAGQRDVAGNLSQAHFVFNSGSLLLQQTVNLNTGVAGPQSTLDAALVPGNLCALFPRIEAMNILQPNQGVVPWQAVGIKTTVISGSYSEVKPIGYNPATGATDLYDPAQAPPLFYALPLNSINVKSPTVSAGCGRGNPFTGDIGNRFYTVGYFPWATDHFMYARHIDGVTGIDDPNYYQINQGPVDYLNYYKADASKSLALTNCSNTGQGQYAAWYDAMGNILDKTNMGTTPQFKTTGVSGINPPAAGGLFPNPVTDKLFLPEGGRYTIYDIKGAVVLHGTTEAARAISTTALPAGTYLIRYGDDPVGKRQSFTKQ